MQHYWDVIRGRAHILTSGHRDPSHTSVNREHFNGTWQILTWKWVRHGQRKRRRLNLRQHCSESTVSYMGRAKQPGSISGSEGSPELLPSLAPPLTSNTASRNNTREPFSCINYGQCPKNQVRTLSGVDLSHMKHIAGHCLCPTRSPLLEIRFRRVVVPG